MVHAWKDQAKNIAMQIGHCSPMFQTIVLYTYIVVLSFYILRTIVPVLVLSLSIYHYSHSFKDISSYHNTDDNHPEQK